MFFFADSCCYSNIDTHIKLKFYFKPFCMSMETPKAYILEKMGYMALKRALYAKNSIYLAGHGNWRLPLQDQTRFGHQLKTLLGFFD